MRYDIEDFKKYVDEIVELKSLARISNSSNKVQFLQIRECLAAKKKNLKSYKSQHYFGNFSKLGFGVGYGCSDPLVQS